VWTARSGFTKIQAQRNAWNVQETVWPANRQQTVPNVKSDTGPMEDRVRDVRRRGVFPATRLESVMTVRKELS
jgi:hypothetical protein